MKEIKLILASMLCALAIVSCSTDKGELTEKRVVSLLNQSSMIPEIYCDLIIFEGELGYWIGNKRQVNRGGNWSLIEEDGELAAAHNPTIPSPHSVMTSGTKLLDKSGRAACVVGLNGATLSKCRGCDMCYNRFKDEGLINYEVIQHSADSLASMRIKTSLTSKGEKLRFASQNIAKFDKESSSNSTLVKFADYVFTSIRAISRREAKASAEVEYYIDYTPFGMSWGYTTDPKNLHIDKFYFELIDGEWVISETL